MSNPRRGVSRSVVAAAVTALAMSLAPLSGPAPARAAPSGPVAEWKFNETSGTTAGDSIGNNDGTLIGNPTWSPSGGHEGGALVFDGSGDGVQIASAAALEPTSLSVTLWMKGTRTANGEWDSLLQKGASACDAGSYGLQAYATTPNVSPGEAQARVEVSDPGYAGSASPEAAIWNGDWHLIAFTSDSAGQVAKLYVDGIPSNAQFAPLLYSLPTASDLFIGHEPADCPDARDFQGSIDDVRIYNRALSAGEVLTLFGSTVSTSASLALQDNPVEYGTWTYANVTVTPTPTEATAVRIYDVTGGGHTLVGANEVSPLDGVGRVQINLYPSYLSVGSHDLAAEVDAIGPFAAATSNTVALAVDRIVNAVTLTAPTSAVPGESVQLDATFSKGTDGTVTFFEDHGNGDIAEIGTTTPAWNGSMYAAAMMTGALSIGDHAFFVRVNETAIIAGVDSDSTIVHVGVVPTVTYAGSVGVLQAHHAVELQASVGPASPISSPPPVTGQVTFRDGATELGTIDYAVTSTLSVPSMTVGTHSITAQYNGDAFYQGSTSEISVVEIAPDTVDATGVTVQYAVFYPYKDGYRDTDAIKGNRLEPLSVSIRIYNANNGLVKSVSLARAAGAYSYAWNGRTSSGTILAAGKYRVVQTLTDPFGTKKAFTTFATISSKRLVSHATYVTRYGYPPTASGEGGTGHGYYSSTGKYLKLVPGSDGYVVAGWQFTLPSATVYRALKFQAYAKGVRGTGNVIGGQNFQSCPLSSAWYVECFDHLGPLGGATTAWYSTTLSPTYNRTGRTVRGLVLVQASTMYIYKVRVYVAYQTLQ